MHMQATNQKFYGWTIVFATGVLYALLGSFGLAAAQIVIPVMAVDPAVSMNRSMIGLGFTFFILMQGLPGPLIGQLIAKKGAKISFMLSAGIIIITGILLGLLCGVSTVAYILLFGIVLSVGSTMGGQIATQTTISNWFTQKRGLAMSITMGFSGLICFAFPLITNAIVGGGNWKMGFYLISIVAAIALIVAAVFIKNKPADLNQVPDGTAKAAPGKTAAAAVSPVYKTSEHKTSKEALKSSAFWFILITSFSIFAALNLAVSSGVLHFKGLGIDATVVAAAVAVEGIAAVAVSLLIAPLADRIEPIRIAGVCALLTGIGAFLAFSSGTASIPVLYCYYILLGIGFGGNAIVMPTAFANYFGYTHFPKIMGVVLLLLSVFSGLIPTIAGAVYDSSGSYTPMFLAIAVICLAGTLTAFLVRFPDKGKA
jgi:MFS family permease